MRRILIVDDAEEAREILAIALATIPGTAVETVANPLDALAAARVDVLITDVRMREMDGITLLAQLRGRGCWPRCGALVVSGETDPDLPRRAVESGAHMFFRKPFSAGAVRKAVISLLEGCHDQT